MDLRSRSQPAHAGFRKYGGWSELPGHILEEFFDPYYGSNLDKATELAYKYYTGELPMPQDFFENLCSDTHPMKPRWR